MKYYLPLLFLLIIPVFCFGQSKLIVEGIILDAESDKAIPYAHVGIQAEHVGTASIQDGTFTLELDQKYRDDTLQVSAIGYQTEKYLLSSVLESNSPLRLQPKTYQMKEITVTDNRPETKWIGKKVRPILGSGARGLARGGDRIGAAFAFRVNWNRFLPLKLLHARMFLKRNKNDSLKMRCSIAAVDSSSKRPGRNLIPQAVITTSTKDKGWITCDFNKHDIYIEQKHFYVIFEWLTNKNHVYAPMYATGAFFNSTGYMRSHAMGKWKEAPSGLIYSLKVQY
ncbi:MAG: carboxypeptidase-like regulatory domain-containing protein [Balneolaceae bacterium]|nr:carboxypeptidase-like regulatory domain-containing protein [Balneolaceae bacterium]